MASCGIFEHDQPRFHRFAVFRFESVFDFLLGRLDLIGGHFLQGQHRPNDVVGILLGGDVPFLLDHLDPLVGRNAEFLRQPIDLVADFLARDGDIPLVAILDDQILVEHRVQNFAAIMSQAFLSKLLPADCVAVHLSDDLQLLRLRDDRRRGFGGHVGRRTLGVGRRGSTKRANRQAHAHNGNCADGNTQSAFPLARARSVDRRIDWSVDW